MSEAEAERQIWKQLRAFDPKPRHAPALLVSLIVLIAALGVSYATGHRSLTVVILAVGVPLFLLSAWGRTRPHFLRCVGWVQTVVGTLLTYLIVPPVYVVGVVLPGWWRKSRRQQPLDLARDTRGSYWRSVRRDPAALVRKPFLHEAPPVAGGSTSAISLVVQLVGVILILVALDYGLGRAYGPSLQRSLVVDFWAASPANDTESWYSQYWQDLRSFEHDRANYHPYRVWTQKPRSSRYINIDQIGGNVIRRSYNPPAVLDDPRAVDVLFFGGSTMWGTGNDDDGTIPSAFARIAESQGIPVRVTNYGIRGYSSFQELIYWQTLQIQGIEADFVVFYDGYNDLASVLQDLRTLNQGPVVPRHLYTSFLAERIRDPHDIPNALRETSLARTILENHIKDPSITWKQLTGIPERALLALKVSKDDIAKHVMGPYGHVVATTTRTAVGEPWEPVFFWQPTLVTRAASEPGYQHATDPRSEGPLYQSIYSHLVDNLPPGVVDLTHALDSMPLEYFIDGVHVNNQGSKLVAQAMFDHMRAKLAARAHAKATGIAQDH